MGTGTEDVACRKEHEMIAGKRVVLTGGSTGIGRAILAHLSKQGAEILTLARERKPLIEALYHAEVREERGLVADMSRAEDIASVFAEADRQLGGLDVLIANAALGAESLELMDEAAWRYVVETNLVGYLACVHAALGRMLQQGSGHIILISSISPDIKAPGESVYAATKAGVDAFALTLRKEVGDRNVKVTVIQPGSVGSDMQPCSVEEQRKAIARSEMLFAEEIAETVEFVLTRSQRCDVSLLRVEPLRQVAG